MPTWTGVASGRVLRAVRLHRRWRQRDVAARSARQPVHRVPCRTGTAGPSSRSEPTGPDRGRPGRLRSSWMPDGTTAIVDRLIDRAHASIVEHVVRELRDLGWEVLVEFGFNHYGDRGSVDVLAWHPATRTLLIVEVKSLLTDLQATFTSLAPRCAIVPMLARRDLGWDVTVSQSTGCDAGNHGEPHHRGAPRRRPSTSCSRTGCPRFGRGSGDRTARSRGSGSCHPCPPGLLRT